MTSALEGGGGPQKANKRNKMGRFLYVTRGLKNPKLLRTLYMEAP